MELRFPGNNLLPQLLTARPAQAERLTGTAAVQTLLQLGRQFSATVVERQGAGQYLLEVYQPGVRNQGTMLRAMSVTELEPGQSLRLEVVDNGPPPQLRVLPPPLEDHQEVLSQALRQFLPRQENLQGVMDRLSRFVAQHPDANDTHLPATLRDALRNVLGAMPDKGALSTPEGLKQAIQNSGLFLEAKLAQQAQAPATPANAAPSLAQDMKAKLLKLADNLSARLPTLEESAPQQEGEADAVVVFSRPSLASPPHPGASAPQARLANVSPQTLPAPFSAETAVSAEEMPLTAPPPSPGGPATPESKTVPGGQNAQPSPAMADEADDATPGATSHPHSVARSAVQDPTPVITTALREGELKDLLNKTESALAKIVLDQLASAPQPDSATQSWRLDLPFQNQGRAEAASLTISREGGHQAGSEAEANLPWAVTLELKPPGLGVLHSRLTLYRGEVSGVFWSDAPATAELVRQHLDILDFRLRAAGLKTGQLDAAVGTPPETDSTRARPRLLDERV